MSALGLSVRRRSGVRSVVISRKFQFHALIGPILSFNNQAYKTTQLTNDDKSTW